mgnify:CR=1 FL=1
MRATANRAAILVLNDFFDERWRATINEREVELMPANYLMRAVALPEGEHMVTFTYSPPVLGFALTAGSWIFFATLILGVGIAGVLKRDKDLCE